MSHSDEDDIQIVEREDTKRDDLMEKPGDPPVVARMVIEIRSDGSRTIARGALEEVVSGEKVAIEAHGTTPMALAANLTKSLLSAPLMAAQLFAKAGPDGGPPRLFAPKERPSSDSGGLRGAVKDTAKRAVKRLLRRDTPEDE
ncbi:MAG: hypothetical protein H6718_05750 [Polyangiaceae bacterium]|nr:hypothetical protein [Myxococcales bacterium]MCB9584879.1 hypothetical protein [Polyangiaceae bacterium]MCB9607548.1 hypothetical protein [Polyangiaceae bacterium]